MWTVGAAAATVPGGPTGLTATPGDRQVALQWQAPSDGGSPITYYTVYTNPGNIVHNTSGPTTTFTVSPLTNGTQYTFNVTATNAVGTGTTSLPVTATPRGAPDPPTNLAATPGDGQVSLSWTAPTNTGGSPIDHYTITVSPGGATSQTSSTSSTVTGLNNGTTYTFSVTATNGVPLTSPPVTTTATPTAPPSPTPTPVNATIGLDPTAGGPSVGITVTGQLFLPNESMTLYWDDPSRPAPGGSAQADGSGTFHVVVKPFPGDAPGVHHLYASVPPKPHADFTLEGPPTPTPAASPTPTESPSPSPSASPSPTESPSQSPSSSPVPVAAISGIDIITRPPFVFLPIIGALGLLGVIAYWALSANRRNRTSALPASVVHRSVRPDYGAPFGTPAPPSSVIAPPPPAPAPPAAPPPVEPPPAEPPQAEPPSPGRPQASEPLPPAAPSPPEVDWPRPPTSAEPPGAPDEPPDLPEPSE